MENCIICSRDKFEPLVWFYSDLLKKLFHRIAICLNCGHIQVYPLFSENELQNINNKYFENIFLNNNNNNVVNNKKLAKIDERLLPYIKEGMTVLDIGAGEAWAMDYFQNKKCKYYAIEAVPKLAESIKKRGGIVVANNILDNLSEYNSFFDIIIFRHLIEHLLAPVFVLKKLKNILNDEGFIYIALPNGAEPEKNIGFEKIKNKGFRRSFIRPVHISYFHIGNLKRIINEVALKPIEEDTENEIFLLLQHSNCSNIEYVNYYTEQKNIYKSTARKTFFDDYRKIIINVTKVLIKRMMRTQS